MIMIGNEQIKIITLSRLPPAGQPIPNEGIFLCALRYAERTLAACASPEDIRNVTYTEAVREVAVRRSWHGYDGANIENEAALYNGLVTGIVLGKWVIPTCDLGRVLSRNKTAGDFEGSLVIESKIADCSNWYWLCTPHRREKMSSIRLSDGMVAGWGRDCNRSSCRPVRFVDATRLSLA
ncbi:MAG: hypothetical protein SFW62_03520 [Alphaproteobacteria bacterium]|nr:hypothetical protein [Alphaproteobacteria bacterium]